MLLKFSGRLDVKSFSYIAFSIHQPDFHFQGLNVKEIAAQNKIDPKKLGMTSH